jgi:hypothetical protein
LVASVSGVYLCQIVGVLSRRFDFVEGGESTGIDGTKSRSYIGTYVGDASMGCAGRELTPAFTHCVASGCLVWMDTVAGVYDFVGTSLDGIDSACSTGLGMARATATKNERTKVDTRIMMIVLLGSLRTEQKIKTAVVQGLQEQISSRGWDSGMQSILPPLYICSPR